MRKDPKPVIKDQYTAAQVYFICVVGLLVFESFFFFLPSYLMTLIKRGKSSNNLLPLTPNPSS